MIWRLMQQLPTVQAVEILHGVEERRRILSDVEYLGDVRVMQRGGDAGFVQEHADEATVLR